MFPTQIEGADPARPAPDRELPDRVTRDGHWTTSRSAARSSANSPASWPHRPTENIGAELQHHIKTIIGIHQDHGDGVRHHPAHPDRQGPPRHRPAPQARTVREPAMTALRFHLRRHPHPIGRYGGTWPASAPTTSAPSRSKALMRATPGRLDRRRGHHLRLRQPGRRGQPQRGPHVRPARRLPVEVPGTTVNRLCGSGMDAMGWPRARSSPANRADDRRRRRESMSRAPS